MRRHAAEDARRVVVPWMTMNGADAPAEDGRIARFGGDTMGTTWSVSCVVDAGEAQERIDVIDATIRAVLDSVIAQMSNWRADSAISGFNSALFDSWVSLPPACFKVVEAALNAARLSGGAFDPSAGPLVDLWGFGPSGRRLLAPGPDDVEAVRRRCGWSRIELDHAAHAVRQPGGASLDLGSIAKGHAVDAVSDALDEIGITHRLVEIGGELRGDGLKPDGMPWWVEIETPPGDGACEGTTAHDLIALHGLAVATSGDYRRYFLDADARRQMHIVDPRTGYPASHALASVTVLHAQCMLADAYSTALMVLGREAGMAFAAREGLAARCVARTPEGFTESVSPAYAAMLE
ncbi:FAD:protein FMN transferase [Caballeronia sp. LZ035]|uniref:FAD:protein FMN transferase n=1 Tax=Caballeronia sp. LZ035 TaxID=3038568 RepID=UPI0038D360CD